MPCADAGANVKPRLNVVPEALYAQAFKNGVDTPTGTISNPLCVGNLAELCVIGVACEYLSYMLQIFRLVYPSHLAWAKMSKMTADVQDP